MKSVKATILALACAVMLTLPAVAENPVEGDPTGGTGVMWLYDSPLCVVETITDLGGGQWQYTYKFENVDTARLWHFGVWTSFSPLTSTATWATHPQWSFGQVDINSVSPEYDPRPNLDPTVQYLANTWGPNFPNTTDPIVPGESVDGFSYVASTFDDSPKYYFYETIESGWAPNNGGFLAAVGQTCTEGPTAVEHTTWGQIRMLFR